MIQPRLDSDRAARLTRVCSDVAEVADLLGAEPAHLLARLREELPAAEVDAVLAEVTSLLRAKGLVGGEATNRGPGYLPLAGIRGRRPEVVLVCPGDLCDRMEIPRAGESPRCAVWDCPLPEFRLDR
jgi:hypothetical protein